MSFNLGHDISTKGEDFQRLHGVESGKIKKGVKVTQREVNLTLENKSPARGASLLPKYHLPEESTT